MESRAPWLPEPNSTPYCVAQIGLELTVLSQLLSSYDHRHMPPHPAGHYTSMFCHLLLGWHKHLLTQIGHPQKHQFHPSPAWWVNDFIGFTQNSMVTSNAHIPTEPSPDLVCPLQGNFCPLHTLAGPAAVEVGLRRWGSDALPTPPSEDLLGWVTASQMKMLMAALLRGQLSTAQPLLATVGAAGITVLWGEGGALSRHGGTRL